MNSLHRKLLRDLARMRGQVITIALVVACGIATQVSLATTYRSLEASRASYYAHARFADLFAHLDRAPRSIVGRIEALPGVARAEGHVVWDCRLEREGVTHPMLGHFVSLEGTAGERLNEVFIREGRMVESGSPREIVVSELFAHARGLHPGHSLVAVLGGRRVTLQIVGVGGSPEYVWIVQPGTGLPDAEGYGVIWMDGAALAHGLDLYGAVNDIAIQLSADASPEDTRVAVDRLLDAYGGVGCVDRAHQPSNYMVEQKIAQIRGESLEVPIIFMGVAAFLLNLVLSRIVGTQREQIATLKALGYTSGSLVRHYLQLGGAICFLGAVLGLLLGVLGGEGLAHLFVSYYNFPEVVFRLDASSLSVSVGLSFLAGAIGTLTAVRKTVNLSPAEAMQPAAPESFRPTIIEYLRIDRLFGVAGRMVLRDIERHPLRLVLSTFAVALGTSILLVGMTTIDSLENMLDEQFTRVEGEDINVTFNRPTSARALRELLHIPGVNFVEAQRAVPVRLRFGPRWRELAIQGLTPNPVLRRYRDATGAVLHLPLEGIALSRPLGKMLDLHIGDEIDVEVLESGRRSFRLTVNAFVDDIVGLSAYMDLAALERRLDEMPTVTGALLAIDRSAVQDVTERLEALPAVAGITRPDLDRAQFDAQEANVLRNMEVMLVFFAAVIAVGVVFNNARIALAVRSRDLATLRILGFTRGEVAMVLLGEQAVQVVLGVAVGLLLGRLLGQLALAAVPPDLFRVPMALAMSSYMLAAGTVLVAGLGSALRVRRDADRLDLVAVLKARD